MARPWSAGTALKARYEEAMTTRRPMSFEDASVGLPGRRVEFNLFPWDDGLGVSFRDWTDRFRAEQALRQSEQRLRLAVDAARLAIWEFDVARGEMKRVAFTPRDVEAAAVRRYRPGAEP